MAAAMYAPNGPGMNEVTKPMTSSCIGMNQGHLSSDQVRYPAYSKKMPNARQNKPVLTVDPASDEDVSLIPRAYRFTALRLPNNPSA